MATVVYQGSQSCLDNSQLVEARMLRLRLSSPKPHFSQSLELATKAIVLDTANTIKEVGDKKCGNEEVSHKSHFLHDQQASSNRDSGGWTFFHALYNTAQGPKEAHGKETAYIHPLVRHSSSRLSDKSLEICTESLGSETGSDVSAISSLFLSSSCFKEDESLTSSVCHAGTEVRENRFGLLSSSASKQKSSQLSSAKRANSRGFPPPLTTMNGSGSLHVKPHREDGRLIIQAIKSPSTRPCFEAERCNGRLRLSIVEDSPVSSLSADETHDKEESKNEMDCHKRVQHEMDGIQEQSDDGNDGCLVEGMDMSELDTKGEFGLEDFRRPNRCKEEGELENKRLLNWEPFWVAAS